MKAAYYAVIEHIDFEVGKLLNYLEKTNQRENTLILFHSDHGELLGDHGLYGKGSFFYEPSVRVPFIVSMPSIFPQNKQIDDLVELVDIVPTLYEILGEEIPKRVQGKSLLPLINGEKNINTGMEFIRNTIMPILNYLVIRGFTQPCGVKMIIKS